MELFHCGSGTSRVAGGENEFLLGLFSCAPGCSLAFVGGNFRSNGGPPSAMVVPKPIAHHSKSEWNFFHLSSTNLCMRVMHTFCMSAMPNGGHTKLVIILTGSTTDNEATHQSNGFIKRRR